MEETAITLTDAIEQSRTQSYRRSVTIGAEFLREVGAALKPHNLMRDPKPTEIVAFAMLVAQEMLPAMKSERVARLWQKRNRSKVLSRRKRSIETAERLQAERTQARAAAMAVKP